MQDTVTSVEQAEEIEASSPTARSRLADFYLEYGIEAVAAIGAVMARPDLELRIVDAGILAVDYKDDWTGDTLRAGCRNMEPEAGAWRFIARSVAGIPRRKSY